MFRDFVLSAIIFACVLVNVVLACLNVVFGNTVAMVVNIIAAVICFVFLIKSVTGW